MKFKDITITIQDRIQEREMNGKKEIRRKFHFDYGESDITVESRLRMRHQKGTREKAQLGAMVTARLSPCDPTGIRGRTQEL